MTSRAQQQKNVNDTTNAWERFRATFQTTLPRNKAQLVKAANLAGTKRGYG